MCGTDGKTYTNECHLEVESCRSQQSIEVASRGPCGTRYSLRPDRVAEYCDERVCLSVCVCLSALRGDITHYHVDIQAMWWWVMSGFNDFFCFFFDPSPLTLWINIPKYAAHICKD